MSYFCKVFYYLLIFLLFFSCSKLEDISDPSAPDGEIEWIIGVSDDGKGQLPENSASNLSIGVLNATDPNPYDEVSYILDKQAIDGQDVNFFKIVVEDSTGIANLKTNDNEINFEAIGGSKEVELTIKATDDSPAIQSSDFLVTVQILDVNETPYYTNINEVVRYADENIEYNFNRVEWTDTDEGQNPTLTHSGPGWLNISSEGQMTGTPQTSDIGNNSFVLTISDGAIDVQEEVNIEVRENLAPVFSNISSIPQTITVGCWNVNQELVDLSWYDPNNTTSYFTGNDIISFSVVENIGWMNWSEDGKLFCYSAPENSDGGMSTVTIMLEDNRPNSSKSTEYQFDLTVIANDAPVFSNLSSFPSEMNSGDTLSFDIDWVDPNEDQTTFDLLVGIGSNTYSTSQLSWISIDQSGLVIVIPGSNNNGDKTFTFSVSDGCYTTTESKPFTIN
ncbi:MAG: Ig-like domain-containing protein [Candidatus Neomarinimicrobiota bacterium]